ncbi:MAG: alpha/beta hydrolase family protein, partial [Bacteroidales bacterium]
MKLINVKYYMLQCVVALLLITSGSSAVAQQTLFTPEDALNLVSESIRDMTDDGKYLIITSATRRDRMGTDHKRYRDPSYVSPSFANIRVLDTETGNSWPLFDNKVILSGMDISPDNQQLAVMIYLDGDYRIFTYELEKQKLRQVKLKLDKKIASNTPFTWAPDNSGILLSLRGDGWQQKADSMYTEATVGPRIVYDASRPFLKWDAIANFNSLTIPALLDPETGKAQELLPEGNYTSINFTKQVDRMNYMVVEPLKTTYERGSGTKYGLYSLQLDNDGITDTLAKPSTSRLSANWNEDNTQYAYADSGKVMIRSVYEAEPAMVSMDTTEIVKGDTAKAKFSVMQWSPDQTKILASSKKGYWLIDIESRQMELVYELPEDIEKEPRLSIEQWSPDGRYWYMSYAARDRWERGLVRYDLISQTFTDLFKDSNIYGRWMMTKDGEMFIYSFSDGDTPADYYMIDDSFRNPVRLTESNPWISGKKLTRSELVKYRDVDGKELYGILYYPVDYKEGQTYPLVCEIYETFFDNGFNANMNIVTGEGFFGFRPSVNLIEGYPGEAWVKGITTGINMLIERGLVDPDKLGVHGTSYGGYAASLLITQTDRFAAAINISGKVNIISFLGDSPKIGTRNYSAAENGQDRLGASLWEAPLKYFETTAVLHADRITTPHLLLTGEGDWNVPGVNSRELYYAMRRLGKEVVWVNYFNGGHGAGWASDEADYYDQWNRMIKFYKTSFEKKEKEKENG